MLPSTQDGGLSFAKFLAEEDSRIRSRASVERSQRKVSFKRPDVLEVLHKSLDTREINFNNTVKETRQYTKIDLSKLHRATDK